MRVKRVLMPGWVGVVDGARPDRRTGRVRWRRSLRTCRHWTEDGVGRPPEYCDDPTHTRGAAWRARRDARAAAGAAVPDDLDRPVSMARARAAEYAEQVTGQVLTLTATLNTVLEELRTLG